MALGNFTSRPSALFQTMREIKKEKKIFRRNVSHSVLLKEFEYVIKNQLNIIIDLYGLPGSGKSEDAFSLWFHWKRLNTVLLNRDVNLIITFSRWQTIQAVKNAKDGDLILQDEDTRLSGHGSASAIAQMNNLLDTIRETQISFIFISPHEKATLTLANLYIEQLLKDKVNRRNLIKIYNTKHILEGHAIIGLHNDHEFRKDYLKRKTKNIEKLKNSLGRDSVQIQEEQLEDDFNLIKDYADKKGFALDKKDKINIACRLAGVSGHVDYIKTLTNYVLLTKGNQIYNPNILGLHNPQIIQGDLSKFLVLRNIIHNYFQTNLSVPLSFSRIATSMLLWQVQRRNRRGVDLRPETFSLDDVIRKDIATEWKDEITPQAIYTAISEQGSKYNKVWNKLNTHDLEKIGETYAYTILKAEINEFYKSDNLNPLKGLTPTVLFQHKDSWHRLNSVKDNKPFDLVIHRDKSEQSTVVFNVKLLTRSHIKSSTERFGFGEQHPAIKVLWRIWTRPYKEQLDILSDGLDYQSTTFEELFKLIDEKNGEKK